MIEDSIAGVEAAKAARADVRRRHPQLRARRSAARRRHLVVDRLDDVTDAALSALAERSFGRERPRRARFALGASRCSAPSCATARRRKLVPTFRASSRARRPGKRAASEPSAVSRWGPSKALCTRVAATARARSRGRRKKPRLGANWISLTPFGRVEDLAPSGIDPTFEAPFAENRRAVARAIVQAHRKGLRVLIVRTCGSRPAATTGVVNRPR